MGALEEEEFGEGIDEKDIEEIGRRRTRSMTAVEKRELERDKTATFWLQMDNTECFDDVTVYAVEVPASEHKAPEVVEAKERELENLNKYEVFEEVEDCGQERITSRWVITKKEQADGQKSEYKGRLVARGFQETSPPQSNSPTVQRGSLNLLLSRCYSF